MSYLDELKQQSENSLNERRKAIDDANKKEEFGNENLLKITLDPKTETCQIRLRFMPPKQGSNVAYVDKYIHAFKNAGTMLFENCPTSIKKKCYVCEQNKETYKYNPDIVKAERKRRHKVYANVFVMEDSTNPDNEGKNFIWEFGDSILGKIEEAINPTSKYDDSFDPFNLFTGADFVLIVCKVDGRWSYDKSKFLKPSAFEKSDEEIEEILDNLYDLEEIVSPDKFKSYEELKDRYDYVMNGSSTKPNSSLEESYEKPVRTSKAVKELENNLPEINLDDLPF